MKSGRIFFVDWIVAFLLFSVFMSFYGCRGAKSVNSDLNAAENMMECYPDSALIILESINASDLNEKSLKARYALLKSMALDKNYIDTTTFDVLQPAIDYYLEKGTPDEKLRTFYYQGRIYQNRNERDSALHSFVRGIDIADKCNDSLTIARTLVVQGGIYRDFYDFPASSEAYLKAANIYSRKSLDDLEFDCLSMGLDNFMILRNMDKADSVLKLLGRFVDLDNQQLQLLRSHKMSYMYLFGSNQEIRDVIDKNKDGIEDTSYNTNGMLNLARAYNRLGENERAIRQLNYLDEIRADYDTLKYLSIKFMILEDLEDYEAALSTYKDLIYRNEVIDASKFEQKSQSIEEKHQLELQAKRDDERNKKIIWSCIVVLIILSMGSIILVLIARRNKISKDLAMQKAISSELENEKLKSENEIVLQNARIAELENENLKSENEIVNQKVRMTELENDKLKTEREKLTLENRNLQLERDNKALEAENLAHRVEVLEGESESLRELLESHKEMPEEVRKTIQTRIEMLNAYLASQISDHKEFEKTYDAWVEELTADTEEFMNSNRLAFQASHPSFIKYFEDHGLTIGEINYVCLYAIGLRGKDVGNYMKKRSHVNISSAIRKKLGIDKHETNIGIYVRKLLQKL